MFFEKICDNNKRYKYKCYPHINYCTYGTLKNIHENISDKIISDLFWNYKERKILSQLLLKGINMNNWEIIYKPFGMGEHLYVYVIHVKKTFCQIKPELAKLK